MDYVLVGLVAIVVGLGGGGYLGYEYGRRVEAATQLLAARLKAASEVVKGR